MEGFISFVPLLTIIAIIYGVAKYRGKKHQTEFAHQENPIPQHSDSAKLKKCKDCGHGISKKATTCPQCGAPAKRQPVGCGGAVLFILIFAFGATYFFGQSGYDGQTDIRPQVEASPAPASLIDDISSGLQKGFTLRHVYTAHSKVHKRAYFIAGELVGPGASGQVAVWWRTGVPEGGGLLFSVNEYAKGFSDFGDGSTTKAAVTMSDPPARKLQGFVNKMVDSQGRGD